MDNRDGYWPDWLAGTQAHEIGYDLELRGRLVLRFVEQWGMVQGMTGSEDSSGRARLDLMSPPMVVDRAVEMARCVVAQLEEQGWIARPADNAEALVRRSGELAALRSEVEHARWKDRLK